MKRAHTRRILLIGAGVLMGLPSLTVSAAEGVAKGEPTQQPGQQGMDLGKQAESSNVIMGGPEIIHGRITKIDGERYAIKGDRGQEVTLRVTKETNVVCAGSDEARFTTSREGMKEREEIPPTPFMAEQSGKQGQKQQSAKKDKGTSTKHPSELKGMVGTSDPKAKEDVARGSGFAVGNCHFKVGDRVQVEATDMGTASTIKQVASK